MAPLRSSRSSRHLHQDGGAQGRLRSGVVEHDPMEGLPVRRWELADVTIKQDAKGEEIYDDGKEGTKTDWPWPDLPLPKDFHLLPSHSQEMLRRARAPNKNPNIAVFNKERGEYERPNLNPSNPAATTPVGKSVDFNDKNAIPALEHSTDPKDNEADGMEADDDVDSEKPIPEEPRERTITLKRWIPLPQSIADKKPDPKYLAARRPGLPPLYGHQLATTAVSHNAGYEPNISSTLLSQGNAVGGSTTVPADVGTNPSGSTIPIGSSMPLPSGATQGQAEVRRRPPPPPPKRRKKGGPGRNRRRTGAGGSSAPSGNMIHGYAVGGPGSDTQQGAAFSHQERAGGTAMTTTTENAQIGGQATIGAGIPVAATRDIEMGDVEAEAEGDSSSTGEEEEEGSDEGDNDEGDGPGPAVIMATDNSVDPTAATTMPPKTTEAAQATPPSPPIAQAAEAPPPSPKVEIAEAPSTTTTAEVAEARPPSTSTAEVAEVPPPSTTMAEVTEVPPSSTTMAEAAEAPPPSITTAEAIEALPPTTITAVEAVEVLPPPAITTVEAAEAAPPSLPTAKAAKAPPPPPAKVEAAKAPRQTTKLTPTTTKARAQIQTLPPPPPGLPAKPPTPAVLTNQEKAASSTHKNGESESAPGP